VVEKNELVFYIPRRNRQILHLKIYSLKAIIVKKVMIETKNIIIMIDEKRKKDYRGIILSLFLKSEIKIVNISRTSKSIP
jgi:hypothetical protein